MGIAGGGHGLIFKKILKFHRQRPALQLVSVKFNLRISYIFLEQSKQPKPDVGKETRVVGGRLPSVFGGRELRADGGQELKTDERGRELDRGEELNSDEGHEFKVDGGQDINQEGGRSKLQETDPMAFSGNIEYGISYC